MTSRLITTSGRGRLHRPLVVLLAAGGLVAGAVSSTAHAAVDAAHQVILFPDRDFVSATGYAPGVPVSVTVTRGVPGTIVATATVTPADDLKTPVFDGLVEVNHPGGGCWVAPGGGTPVGDILQRGDLVTLRQGATVDTSRAQYVTATKARMVAGNLVVTGTAQAMNADGTPAFDANGPVPLAAANLQSRIVAAKGTSFVNTRNKRLIRSDKDGGLFAMNGINWTVTYSGAVATGNQSTAPLGQSRGLAFLPDPATALEVTQSETDEVDGAGACG